MTKNMKWLQWVSEIQAIAQSGLAYCDNEFDKERYIRLEEIITELAAYCSEHQLEDITINSVKIMIFVVVHYVVHLLWSSFYRHGSP